MTETGELPILPLPHPSRLDPPPEYGQWRDEQPVRRVKAPNGKDVWIVTSYADVRAVLSDSRFSSDSRHPAFPAPALEVLPPGWFINMDPPEHDVLRKMFTRDFTAKRIDQLRPSTQRIADQLIDKMVQSPAPADLVESLALPLPSLVICELLGVPYSEHDFFQQRAKTLVDFARPIEERTASMAELGAYLGGLLFAKEQDPGDDMLSRLAVERVRTGEITMEQAVGMAMLMLVAGHETTANMIGLSTLLLSRHPATVKRLLDEPELVPGAVDELLRYLTIVHMGLPRVATQDVKIGEVTIRADEGVIMALSAANRDPAAFPEADRFDLDRKARHHVAFGHGIHQCVGQQLARMELQIVLVTLFRRLPDLRVTEPMDELDYRDTSGIYGLRKLPISW